MTDHETLISRGFVVRSEDLTASPNIAAAYRAAVYVRKPSESQWPHVYTSDCLAGAYSKAVAATESKKTEQEVADV